MKNNKWYYRVNLETKEIVEYTRIPDVWNNCTGLSSSDDTTLSDLNWAGHNQGFLSKEAAELIGVPSSEFTRMQTLVNECHKNDIRKKRDILLQQSDKAVMPDRWEAYSLSKKTGISEYRESLRNITDSEDLLNITWPALPEGLEYLIDYM